MCTVSIIRVNRNGGSPRSPAVRLACNRDEQRSRPAALPPRIQTYGGRRAILPIDPSSNGTWVAASEAGLAFSLLNVNLPPRAALPGKPLLMRTSRGAIIPSLLDAATLDEAAERAEAFDALAYPPFRLVILDAERGASVYCDGATLRAERFTLSDGPVMFTSSGLGDQLVEAPRRALFEEMFRAGGDLVEVQTTFHRHVWPDRAHLSVCMRRPDARTVSFTTIELCGRDVSLTYHGDAPDTPVTPVHVALRPSGGGWAG